MGWFNKDKTKEEEYNNNLKYMSKAGGTSVGTMQNYLSSGSAIGQVQDAYDQQQKDIEKITYKSVMDQMIQPYQFNETLNQDREVGDYYSLEDTMATYNTMAEQGAEIPGYSPNQELYYMSEFRKVMHMSTDLSDAEIAEQYAIGRKKALDIGTYNQNAAMLSNYTQGAGALSYPIPDGIDTPTGLFGYDLGGSVDPNSYGNAIFDNIGSQDTNYVVNQLDRIAVNATESEKTYMEEYEQSILKAEIDKQGEDSQIGKDIAEIQRLGDEMSSLDTIDATKDYDKELEELGVNIVNELEDTDYARDNPNKYETIRFALTEYDDDKGEFLAFGLGKESAMDLFTKKRQSEIFINTETGDVDPMAYSKYEQMKRYHSEGMLDTLGDAGAIAFDTLNNVLNTATGVVATAGSASMLSTKATIFDPLKVLFTDYTMDDYIADTQSGFKEFGTEKSEEMKMFLKSRGNSFDVTESLLTKTQQEGTVGKAMNGDGVIGMVSELALSIALDPTTYMTLGASGVAKLSKTAKSANESVALGKASKEIADTAKNGALKDLLESGTKIPEETLSKVEKTKSTLGVDLSEASGITSSQIKGKKLGEIFGKLDNDIELNSAILDRGVKEITKLKGDMKKLKDTDSPEYKEASSRIKEVELEMNSADLHNRDSFNYVGQILRNPKVYDSLDETSKLGRIAKSLGRLDEDNLDDFIKMYDDNYSKLTAKSYLKGTLEADIGMNRIGEFKIYDKVIPEKHIAGTLSKLSNVEKYAMDDLGYTKRTIVGDYMLSNALNPLESKSYGELIRKFSNNPAKRAVQPGGVVDEWLNGVERNFRKTAELAGQDPNEVTRTINKMKASMPEDQIIEGVNRYLKDITGQISERPRRSGFINRLNMDDSYMLNNVISDWLEIPAESIAANTKKPGLFGIGKKTNRGIRKFTESDELVLEQEHTFANSLAKQNTNKEINVMALAAEIREIAKVEPKFEEDFIHLYSAVSTSNDLSKSDLLKSIFQYNQGDTDFLLHQNDILHNGIEGVFKKSIHHFMTKPKGEGTVANIEGLIGRFLANDDFKKVFKLVDEDGKNLYSKNQMKVMTQKILVDEIFPTLKPSSSATKNGYKTDFRNMRKLIVNGEITTRDGKVIDLNGDFKPKKKTKDNLSSEQKLDYDALGSRGKAKYLKELNGKQEARNPIIEVFGAFYKQFSDDVMDSMSYSERLDVGMGDIGEGIRGTLRKIANKKWEDIDPNDLYRFVSGEIDVNVLEDWAKAKGIDPKFLPKVHKVLTTRDGVSTRSLADIESPFSKDIEWAEEFLSKKPRVVERYTKTKKETVRKKVSTPGAVFSESEEFSYFKQLVEAMKGGEEIFGKFTRKSLDSALKSVKELYDTDGVRRLGNEIIEFKGDNYKKRIDVFEALKLDTLNGWEDVVKDVPDFSSPIKKMVAGVSDELMEVDEYNELVKKAKATKLGYDEYAAKANAQQDLFLKNQGTWETEFDLDHVFKQGPVAAQKLLDNLSDFMDDLYGQKLDGNYADGINPSEVHDSRRIANGSGKVYDDYINAKMERINGYREKFGDDVVKRVIDGIGHTLAANERLGMNVITEAFKSNPEYLSKSKLGVFSEKRNRVRAAYNKQRTDGTRVNRRNTINAGLNDSWIPLVNTPESITAKAKKLKAEGSRKVRSMKDIDAGRTNKAPIELLNDFFEDTDGGTRPFSTSISQINQVHYQKIIGSILPDMINMNLENLLDDIIVDKRAIGMNKSSITLDELEGTVLKNYSPELREQILANLEESALGKKVDLINNSGTAKLIFKDNDLNYFRNAMRTMDTLQDPSKFAQATNVALNLVKQLSLFGAFSTKFALSVPFMLGGLDGATFARSAKGLLDLTTERSKFIESLVKDRDMFNVFQNVLDMPLEESLRFIKSSSTLSQPAKDMLHKGVLHEYMRNARTGGYVGKYLDTSSNAFKGKLKNLEAGKFPTNPIDELLNNSKLKTMPATKMLFANFDVMDEAVLVRAKDYLSNKDLFYRQLDMKGMSLGKDVLTYEDKVTLATKMAEDDLGVNESLTLAKNGWKGGINKAVMFPSFFFRGLPKLIANYSTTPDAMLSNVKLMNTIEDSQRASGLDSLERTNIPMRDRFNFVFGTDNLGQTGVNLFSPLDILGNISGMAEAGNPIEYMIDNLNPLISTGMEITVGKELDTYGKGLEEASPLYKAKDARLRGDVAGEASAYFELMATQLGGGLGRIAQDTMNLASGYDKYGNRIVSRKNEDYEVAFANGLRRKLGTDGLTKLNIDNIPYFNSLFDDFSRNNSTLSEQLNGDLAATVNNVLYSENAELGAFLGSDQGKEVVQNLYNLQNASDFIKIQQYVSKANADGTKLDALMGEGIGLFGTEEGRRTKDKEQLIAGALEQLQSGKLKYNKYLDAYLKQQQ